MVVLGLVAAVIVVLLTVAIVSSRRKVYSLSGKHVLITGGSSGIGKSVAFEALRRGAAFVTLVARNEEKLQNVKRELQTKPELKNIFVISADVSTPQVSQKLIQGLADLPPVDVLVNSAGITNTGSLTTTTEEEIKAVLNTNLLGSIRVTQVVLPTMISRKSGHIVFVSSQAGQIGLYGYSAYSSSKYALRGLAETLQMEVRPYNIVVSISFPPDTDTPQLQEEQLVRNELVKELSSYGTVFHPSTIASDILTGVERGSFAISHGFDGFILKTVTAGTGPTGSCIEIVTQALLMGIFRLVALTYLFLFNRIVDKHTIKK